jgi:hypothetical protein
LLLRPAEAQLTQARPLEIVSGSCEKSHDASHGGEEMFRSRAAILTALIALACSGLSSAADPKFEARLKQIDEVVNRGPFKPEWKSLENFQVPVWYIDGKFGIFIHWGAYSVPGFGNEWYPRNMYVSGSKEFKHHVET